ncbi:hypothetical protein EK386_02310 [Lysinibacillus antri]|uniref:Uncharacterized protein n=1 Tax=Lysinibacillus antri TaxID=2498145 RepID=A0A432LFN7_9BACI|nr:hypothetical protein EK386_02310 [Lysinibacillus antri]
MNEEFILNMLTLHGINYNKYGNEQDKQAFTNWMNKLQHHKNFSNLEEACNYFIAWGERDEKLSA